MKVEAKKLELERKEEDLLRSVVIIVEGKEEKVVDGALGFMGERGL